MDVRLVGVALFSSLLLTTAVAAQVPVPATRPASRPAAPAASQPVADARRVRELVAQLGDQDFHRRDAAAESLARLGSAALPALDAAREEPDPEVAARAAAIAARIRRDAEPRHESRAAAAVLAWVTDRGGGRGVVAARNAGGRTVVEQVSPRKDWQVRMSRGRGGIDIAFTCPDPSGGPGRVTESRHAASEAELRRAWPTLYRVHEALLSNLDPGGGMRGWWRQFGPEPGEGGEEGGE
jgi:hypothetical protein